MIQYPVFGTIWRFKKAGKAIISVTHDMGLAVKISDRILWLEKGVLVKEKGKQNIINSMKIEGFCTKLIFFTPKDITNRQIELINNLEFIHDKSDPSNDILKGEPICTILFTEKDFSATIPLLKEKEEE